MLVQCVVIIAYSTKLMIHACIGFWMQLQIKQRIGGKAKKSSCFRYNSFRVTTIREQLIYDQILFVKFWVHWLVEVILDVVIMDKNKRARYCTKMDDFSRLRFWKLDDWMARPRTSLNINLRLKYEKREHHRLYCPSTIL